MAGITCDICNQKCVSQHGLRIHKAKSHRDPVPPPIQPSSAASSSSPMTSTAASSSREMASSSRTSSSNKFAELPQPYFIELNPKQSENDHYVSEVTVRRIKRCVNEKSTFLLVSQFGTTFYQTYILRRICMDMNLIFVQYISYYANLQNLDIELFIKDVLETSQKNGKRFLIHVVGKLIHGHRRYKLSSINCPIAFSGISENIPTRIR